MVCELYLNKLVIVRKIVIDVMACTSTQVKAVVLNSLLILCHSLILRKNKQAHFKNVFDKQKIKTKIIIFDKPLKLLILLNLNPQYYF
jgi:hypothetical protein